MPKSRKNPLFYAYSDFGMARVYCFSMFVGAAIILTIGTVAAYEFRKPDSVNRSGGLITGLSLLLILAQFRFENIHKGEELGLQRRATQIASERQYPEGFSKEVIRLGVLREPGTYFWRAALD